MATVTRKPPERIPAPPDGDGELDAVAELTPAEVEDGVVVIEPRRHGVAVRLRELWKHRALLRFFARRSIEKRTARTILGKFWLVLRPFLNAGTKALIFGGLLAAPSNGIPYFLFFLCGMAIWHLFEESVYWSTRGMELNRGLLRKLYIPRILLPVASAAPGLVEGSVYAGFVGLALLGYGLADQHNYLVLGWPLLAAAGALVCAMVFSMGLSLWTSVGSAHTRDVRFSLRYGLGFWFFLTPVIFPISEVPAPFNTIAAFNPMAPLVELFRWGLVDAGAVLRLGLVYSVTFSLVMLISGLWFFNRAEAHAVDRM